MDMDQAAVWLAGSILTMLGLIVVVAGVIAINNLLHKYWKPVRIFTADSWAPFSQAPRYATEEELARIAPHLDEQKKTK
jgi:hypothetical protein